jgi:hypothetical protein
MGKIVTKIDDLISKLTEAKNDAEKFEEKGNLAAGTRVRKVMQEVRKSAQLIRVDVINVKNG